MATPAELSIIQGITSQIDTRKLTEDSMRFFAIAKERALKDLPNVNAFFDSLQPNLPAYVFMRSK